MTHSSNISDQTRAFLLSFKKHPPIFLCQAAFFIESSALCLFCSCCWCSNVYLVLTHTFTWCRPTAHILHINFSTTYYISLEVVLVLCTQFGQLTSCLTTWWLGLKNVQSAHVQGIFFTRFSFILGGQNEPLLLNTLGYKLHSLYLF